MTVDVELLYRQHLSASDRRLLATLAPDGGSLVPALSHPAVEAAVFGTEEAGGGVLAEYSPFLTFATAVHRTAVVLERASFVEERWAPRQRVPVFDVAVLRELLAEPVRRFFLVELLASYTHVASGATWQRTRRGWRRRRFSELDPVRLAGLLEVVGAGERPGIYRRLGDLALFLTGVFPDNASVLDIGAPAAGRLLRLSGVDPVRGEGLGGQELLEHLGSRWYRLAESSAHAGGAPTTSDLVVAGEMGQRFSDARRVLNVVTDHYLFPWRERWFGMG